MPDKKVLIFLLGEMATITFLIIIIITGQEKSPIQ